MQVIFSSDVFELQRYGGVSRYFVEIASRIDMVSGCEAKVATAFHINSYLKESSVSSGVYIPFSPSRIGADKIMRRANKIYCEKIIATKNFDIRHETFYRGNIHQIKARKTVTTVYDLIREKFTPDWKGFEAKQKSLASADAIICISESTAVDLHSFYEVDPSKVSVIYLGVNPNFGKLHIPSSSRSRTIRFLYVGAREGYKDFRTLILAFARSRNLRMNANVIVFGNEFSKEELRIMNEHGVRMNFHHQRGNDSALVKAYREATALVITSQYEGFGLPVIEAMLSGCIVVSSRGGSLAEVGDSLDIPFEVSNAESLANSLELVLENVDSFDPLRELAYRHALNFTWDKTAQETLEVYRSLVSNS